MTGHRLTSPSQLFHLLHDPTFNNQYACFERDPSSTPLSWLALLFVILATAVSALDAEDPLLQDLSRKPTTSARMTDLSERYRTAAMKCLEADNYMWSHNVSTLQALILLIYGINHGYGQSWTLLGLTYNLALSIGCHIDPSHFGLDQVECEERRRCWAGLMMLYTVQNTSMGNLGLPNISSTTRSPADINDAELVLGRADTDLEKTSAQASQMSYLLLKFRLYRICSDICTQVLDVRRASSGTIARLDESIKAEQKHWEEKYLTHTRSAPLPTYHIVHLNILYGYSHQLNLLLYRPAFIDRSSANVSIHEMSVQSCLESAKCLLGIHATFCDSPAFAPFMWYNRGLGSFHAFHAAMVLVAIMCICHDTAMFAELRHLLQQCEARFNAMTDLSPVCRKAAPVLRRFL